jgi:hypothetical protein
MSDSPIFMPGDAVYYTGEKFKTELTSKDGKPFKGWIHAPVLNQDGVFVVEFPDAKDGDYVISGRLLSRARPAKTEKHEGPEIQPRRRSKKPDEEAAG